MERLKSTLLQKRLWIVKKRKEILALEEAKLARLARQKKESGVRLSKVKKERLALMYEEAKLLRVLKQNGQVSL